jgi:hypothetical protein
MNKICPDHSQPAMSPAIWPSQLMHKELSSSPGGEHMNTNVTYKTQSANYIQERSAAQAEYL